MVDRLAADLTPEEARFAQRVRAWTDTAMPAIDPSAIAAVAIAGERRRHGLVGRLADLVRGWSDVALIEDRGQGRPWLVLAVVLALAVAAIIGMSVGNRTHTVLPVGPAANGLIAVDGGGTITLIDPDTGTQRAFGSPSIVWRPVFSPDGRRLAFWSARPTAAQVGCRPPVDPAARQQGPPADVRCDLIAALVTLDPTTMTQSTVATGMSGPGAISWSPDSSSIVFASADGIAVAVVGGPGARRVGEPGITSREPAWSPDGAWIAYRGGRYDGEHGIWLVRPDGSEDHQVTDQQEPDGGMTAVPHWSPDGRRIVSVQGGPGAEHLFTVDAGGANRRALPTTPDPNLPNEIWPSWSPDGTRIAYLRGDTPDCCTAVLRVIAADASTETVLTVIPFGYAAPVWSPDGRRIALTLKSATSGMNDTLAIVDPAQAVPVAEIPANDIAYLSWQRRP
jgi:WD40 repeat protein